jgi:L-asparagine transporter-like permease
MYTELTVFRESKYTLNFVKIYCATLKMTKVKQPQRKSEFRQFHTQTSSILRLVPYAFLFNFHHIKFCKRRFLLYTRCIIIIIIITIKQRRCKILQKRFVSVVDSNFKYAITPPFRGRLRKFLIEITN